MTSSSVNIQGRDKDRKQGLPGLVEPWEVAWGSAVCVHGAGLSCRCRYEPPGTTTTDRRSIGTPSVAARIQRFTP